MHPVSYLRVWYATGQPIQDNDLSRKLKGNVVAGIERYSLQCMALSVFAWEEINREAIWKEMFTDNRVNWGRIVTLIAFASYLAKHFFRVTDYVEEIAFRTREFFNDNLAYWVIEQGSWSELP
ncbi:bcl-2-related protein A1-like [Tubulanus polymorphus]|uniref:bcl-2-related protein A1-like n=1 Tax=Tubulanus polymorphus TaxID=672921 RepID=UPI003DA1C980